MNENSNAVSIVENETVQTELLESLKKLEKKHLFYQRVICALMLVIAIGVVCVVPGTIRTLKVARDTMENANATILQASEAIGQAQTTLEDVSAFVTVGGDELAVAMEKINGIDIEGLNDGIADLKAVIEPLARLFGKR